MSEPQKPPLALDLLRDRVWEVVRRSPTPLFAKLDERKILGPAGYPHPSIPAAGLAMALGAAWPGFPIPHQEFDAATAHLVLAGREAVRFGCPRYFVGRDLIEACQQTQLDVGSMLLSELSYPLDTMVFLLPLGTIVSPSDEDLLYAGFALTGDGFGEIGGIPMAFSVPASPPAVVFYGQARSGTMFASRGLLSLTVMEVSAGTFDPGLGPTIKQVSPGVTESLLTRRVSRAETDSRFLADMVSLVVKLILAVNSSPGLQEDGVEVKPRKVSKGQVKEAIWSPNYLGRHYRIERGPSTGHAGGSTVRSHWRRGHFRRQHHGPGMGLVKTIWIQPVLVGAGSSPS